MQKKKYWENVSLENKGLKIHKSERHLAFHDHETKFTPRC